MSGKDRRLVFVDQTGTRRRVGQSEIQQRIDEGWLPLPGQQVMYSIIDSEGNMHARQIASERLVGQGLESARLAGMRVTFDPAAVSSAYRASLERQHNERIQQDPGMAALSAGTGVVDAVTFGNARNIYRGFGDTGSDDTLNNVVAQRPGWNTAGMLGGTAMTMFAPGFGLGRVAQTGARTTGILGTALRGAAGPGGATVAAGELATTATRGLTSRIANATVRGVAERGVRAGAEGVVGGAAFAFTQANIENRALTAEELASEAGVGGLLGLGIEGALGVGGMGIRALRRTLAGRGGLINEGRTALLDSTGRTGAVNNAEYVVGKLDGGTAQAEDYARATQILDDFDARVAAGSAGPRENLVVLSDPSVQRMLRQSERMQPLARNLEGNLNTIQREIDAISTNPAVNTARMANAFDSGVLPADAAIRTAGTLGQFRSAMEDALARGAGRFHGSDESLLREAQKMISGVTGRVSKGDNLASIYSDLWELKVNLGRNKTFGPAKFQTQAGKELMATVQEGVRSVLRDESIWGSIAKSQGRLDQLQAAHLGLKDALKPLRSKKAFSSDRILSTMKKAGNSDNANETIKSLNQYMDAAQNYLHEAHLAGVSEKSLEAIRGTLAEARAAVKQTSAVSRALNVGKKAVAQETAASGGRNLFEQAPQYFKRMVGGGIAGSVFGVPAHIAAGGGLLFDSVMNRLRNPATRIMRRAAADQNSVNIANRLGKAADKLLARLDGVKMPGNLTAGGFGVSALAFSDLTNRKQVREDYEKIKTELLQLGTSPEVFANRLTMSAAPIDALDPQVGMEIRGVGIRGHQYLVANLPQHPVDPLTRRELSPSLSEMDTFINKFMAVNDPLMLIEKAAEGKLTLDHVEAVRTVWPQLYAEQAYLVADAMNRMTGTPNFQMRMQLATFFGLPDPYLESDFILSMQQSYAQTPQQSQAISSPTTRKLSFSSQQASPMQNQQK